MPTITVHLLGKPHGDMDGAPFRLRSQPAWGVLASLLLTDGACDRRDVLLKRFWPDNPDAPNLRQAICSIRAALGSDRITRRGDLLSLDTTGVSCDVGTINALWRAAREAGGPEERLELLSGAARLVRGELLDSVSASEVGDGWLAAQRAALRERHCGLLREYAADLEQAGNPRGAFEALVQVVKTMPELEPAWSDLLRLGLVTGQGAAAAKLARELELQHITDHILQLEAGGSPPTPREADAFEAAYARRLAQLDERARGRLMRLSVFPAPFTARQAGLVAGVPRRELAEWVERVLVLSSGDRYVLVANARLALARGLGAVERRRLREAHARHYQAWYQATNPSPDQVRAEVPHLQQALDVAMTRSRYEDLYFYFLLRTAGVDGLVDRGRAWCERLGDDAANPLHTRREALFFAGRICIDRREFDRARRFLERALPLYDGPDCAGRRGEVLLQLSVACHHGGDYAAALASGTASVEVFSHLMPDAEANSLRFVSEVHRAHGDFALAYETCIRTLEIQAGYGAGPVSLAETRYQLGTIERLRGNMQQAMAHFEASLQMRFECGCAASQADCLAGMAQCLLAEGRATQAEATIRYALRLFRDTGAADSEAAAMAALGDIHAASGRPAEARAAYAEGRSYWSRRGHARWTAVFEAKMERLQTSAEEARDPSRE